jgi:hypothetical protein
LFGFSFKQTTSLAFRVTTSFYVSTNNAGEIQFLFLLDDIALLVSLFNHCNTCPEISHRGDDVKFSNAS